MSAVRVTSYFDSLQYFETFRPTLSYKMPTLSKSGIHHNLHFWSSSIWREIQGSNDWEGLLTPNSLDDNLRAEILRYGDFTQACYDNFEKNQDSPQAGNSLHSMEDFLDKVGLPDTGYTVTKYIYATSQLGLPAFFKHTSDSHGNTWSQSSNWMAYVAVSTSQDVIRRLGRRDILIAWRGTVTNLEWIENIKDFQRPTGLDPNDHSADECKVETGFLNVYTSSNESSRFNKESAREQLLAEVIRLVNQFSDEQLSITVTGHSLGGALALLSAYDIAELGYNGNGELRETKLGISACRFRSTIPVTVFSFCAPRLGNRVFRERCEQVGVKVLRVFNSRDLVPKVPGVLLNEDTVSFLFDWMDDFFPWAYTHVGTELELDSRMSPYLRRDAGIVEQHELQALLHLVDGYHGHWRRFCPSGKRDIALVNKSSDFLNPELGVEADWGMADKEEAREMRMRGSRSLKRKMSEREVCFEHREALHMGTLLQTVGFFFESSSSRSRRLLRNRTIHQESRIKTFKRLNTFK